MNKQYLFKKLPLLCFFSLLFFAAPASAQDGEALYKANCTTCHTIQEDLIGPALKGVNTRHKEEWLIKWIRNSQAMVKAGDPTAVKLFAQWKTQMTPFNLKDEEIKAILAYIKEEEAKVVAPPPPPNGGGPDDGTPKEDNTWIWLIVAGVILFLLMRVLKSIQAVLGRAVRKKEGLPEPEPKGQWRQAYDWARMNKKLVAVILLVLFVWGSVKAWYGMMDIGIQQGYKPVQPIAYDHMLHAGKNGIACVYCHVGADKGKTAGVPSANICMNCHKFIKKGPTPGSEKEIAKIYEALDYNPTTMTYGNNPKPIQWVRVHNLPDLAYFNHAQHYVVGKIECQTCHGPVQDSMTVASQYSPLTMGWCIDCHKKTEVKTDGNGYYTEFHKEMMAKHQHDTLMTVEDIGGTECARCHY